MELGLQQTRVDLIWLDTPPFSRSTRLRLFISMGTATSAILVALLTFDVELNLELMKSTGSQERRLTVEIRRSELARNPDIETGGRVKAQPAGDEHALNESERPATVEPRARLLPGGTAGPPLGTSPATDWNALQERIARETVDDHWRREHARASMWRQTRSVMFKPVDDAGVVREEEPLLANLNFREPAGVLGVGLTFGSCFIGIPIAGIPVEERSTAITLFYCRES